MIAKLNNDKIIRFLSLCGWRQPVAQLTPGDVPVLYFRAHAGSPTLFIQVNTRPQLVCAVFAMRYRLYSGWRRLLLDRKSVSPEAEVRRLSSLMLANWYTSPQRRSVFRSIHPECSNWTYARIERDPPPKGAERLPINPGH